jgi:hypothetical protein
VKEKTLIPTFSRERRRGEPAQVSDFLSPLPLAGEGRVRVSFS